MVTKNENDMMKIKGKKKVPLIELDNSITLETPLGIKENASVLMSQISQSNTVWMI